MVVVLARQEHEVVHGDRCRLGVQIDGERPGGRHHGGRVGLGRVDRHGRRRCVLLRIHPSCSSTSGQPAATADLVRGLLRRRVRRGPGLGRRGGRRRRRLVLGAVGAGEEDDQDDHPGDDGDDDAVADLLAALLGLGLLRQAALSRRTLAGSLVAGHGPRPYPPRRGLLDRARPAAVPRGPPPRPLSSWRCRWSSRNSEEPRSGTQTASAPWPITSPAPDERAPMSWPW